MKIGREEKTTPVTETGQEKQKQIGVKKKETHVLVSWSWQDLLGLTCRPHPASWGWHRGPQMGAEGSIAWRACYSQSAWSVGLSGARESAFLPSFWAMLRLCSEKHWGRPSAPRAPDRAQSQECCLHRKGKCQSLRHLWLFAAPWTIARQAPLSMGFSRQETGVCNHSLLQGEYAQPRDGTRVSCTAGGFFTVWATREVFGAIWNLRSVGLCCGPLGTNPMALGCLLIPTDGPGWPAAFLALHASLLVAGLQLEFALVPAVLICPCQLPSRAWSPADQPQPAYGIFCCRVLTSFLAGNRALIFELLSPGWTSLPCRGSHPVLGFWLPG